MPALSKNSKAPSNSSVKALGSVSFINPKILSPQIEITGTVCAELIQKVLVYIKVGGVLVVELNPLALKNVVEDILIGAVYWVEEVVGSNPFVV